MKKTAVSGLRSVGQVLVLAAGVFLTGCVTGQDISRFSVTLDQTWKPEITAILRDQGIRVYRTDPGVTFTAMADILRDLGMEVEEANPATGIISAGSVGPVPLTPEEWQAASDVETPRTKSVAGQTIGPLSSMLVYLDPYSYRIFFSAMLESDTQGIRVTLSTRMSYIGAQIQGAQWPTLPPPEAVRIGARKIWDRLDGRLTALGQTPQWVKAEGGDRVVAATVSCQHPDGRVIEASATYCRSVGGTPGVRDHAPSPPKEVEPTVQPGALRSSGTGFAISSSGHLITNNHVIKGCVALQVRQGRQVSAADLVATSTQNDLAVLRLRDPQVVPLEPVRFRDGKAIRPGDSVVAIGYPYRDILSSDAQVTTGTVSALSGIGDDSSILQITAPIQPGNSGGPLYDSAGNVVGVVVATLDPLVMANRRGSIPQNVNFAVKASVVRTFLDSKRLGYLKAISSSHLDAADVGERGVRSVATVECLG